MKTKWIKNTVPAKDGWYWIKYRGKNGMVICPASVCHFETVNLGWIVHTARNDMFTTHTVKLFGAFWFGPEIPLPD